MHYGRSYQKKTPQVDRIEMPTESKHSCCFPWTRPPLSPQQLHSTSGQYAENQNDSG